MGEVASSAPEVLLLAGGSALLSADTPFGPHAAVLLHAPALLNLPLALIGTGGVAHYTVAEGSEVVSFPPVEARALAFDPGPEGAPFRRLALATIVAALRGSNASLGRFFGEPGVNTCNAGTTSTAAPRESRRPAEVDVDPSRARDLLDAVGLDPAVLPSLGLSARLILPEAPLIRAGERAEEAFLVADGRLRISIHILGAGREALGIAGPGEVVGEMALVDDSPRSADVHAHEGPALVYALDRRVFRALLESGDPAGAPLLGGVATILCRRLSESLRKVAVFRILSGPI